MRYMQILPRITVGLFHFFTVDALFQDPPVFIHIKPCRAGQAAKDFQIPDVLLIDKVRFVHQIIISLAFSLLFRIKITFKSQSRIRPRNDSRRKFSCQVPSAGRASFNT